MNKEEFYRSIEEDDSVPEASKPLQALWLVKRDQWDAAHDLCNEIDGTDGSWIHAYLHRVEGDEGNAAYWYARAGKEMPSRAVGLESEWIGLVAAFTGR